MFMRKPIPGEIWTKSQEDHSPWPTGKPDLRMRVIDVRKGWVRFNGILPNGTEYGDFRLDIPLFIETYRPPYRESRFAKWLKHFVGPTATT